MNFVYFAVALISLVLTGAILINVWASMPVIGNIIMSLFVIGLAGAIFVGLRYLWLMANVKLINAGHGPIQFPNLQSLTVGAGKHIDRNALGMNVTELAKDTISSMNTVPEPLALPEPLHATEAMDLVEYNKLQWCFGTIETGEPVILTIPDAVHVLNVASTGQGKTTLTANLLYQLVTKNDEDQYSLFIADLKGTLAEPFTPWCTQTAREAGEYVTLLRGIADLVTLRRQSRDFEAPLVLLVLEEALAIKMMLSPQDLLVYSNALSIISTLGREYRVFILMCNQVDYSSKEFRASRGQFLTRLSGAVLPSAARAMGFIDTEKINKVWTDKLPGQFLLETIDGSRIIRTPRLDLKHGELIKLLPKIEQQTVSTDMPRRSTTVQETTDGPNSSSIGVDYTPQPTSLPEGDIVTDQELFEAYCAIRDGEARTARELAERFSYGKTKGAKIMRRLRELGYIMDDPDHPHKLKED